MDRKVYEQALKATREYVVNEFLCAENTTPWLILQDALNELERRMMIGKAHPERTYPATAVDVFNEFASDHQSELIASGKPGADEDLF